MSSKNLREGIGKEALAGIHRVIPAFKDERGGEPIDAYLTSETINKILDNVLSHLKSQIEQVENPLEYVIPYEGFTGSQIKQAIEKFRQDILSKLQ